MPCVRGSTKKLVAGKPKYPDTIFCIKFARYLVRSILLLNPFNPDAL